MKMGQVFPDLLRGLGTAASVEDGLRLTLRRLVKLTGADGGALRFEPPRGGPLIVVATGRGGPALEAGLRALVTLPPDGARRPRGARGRAPRAIVRRATLGAPGPRGSSDRRPRASVSANLGQRPWRHPARTALRL